jgi:hypothetical protein
MQRFKSLGQAQRFLTAYGPIASHFRPSRHRPSAGEYQQGMTQRFQIRREITGMIKAASGTSEVSPSPSLPGDRLRRSSEAKSRDGRLRAAG